MNELSLFTGAGGGLLGTKLLGWKCLGAVEIEKYPCAVLSQRQKDGCLNEFPIINEDIKNINEESIGILSAYWYNTFSIEGDDMGAPRKNYSQAVSLYEGGLSIGDVAEFFNISRQAMHSILKRRGVSFRSNKRHGEENHFWRGTKANDRAQNLIERAIEKGIIKRKDKCEVCSSNSIFKDGRSGIQAHHDDYNNPLVVRWLCQKCHHDWHKKNKAIKYKEEKVEPRNVIDIITAGFP